MSNPPRLEYATPPPDEPVRSGRLALGFAGAAAYALLLVPCLLAMGVIASHDTNRTDLAYPGIAALVCVWRFDAALRHLWSSRPRRQRG